MSLYKACAYKYIREMRYHQLRVYFYKEVKGFWEFHGIPAYSINEGIQDVPLEYYNIFKKSKKLKVSEHCVLVVPQRVLYSFSPFNSPYLCQYEIQSH